MRRLTCLLMLGLCALAACGGEDDEESIEDLLDNAFAQRINSADLKIEAELELKGRLKEPLRIEAEGPYRVNPGKLPSSDIELRVSSDGGGQTITSGVLITGDRSFLKFQDVYYEQPRAQVRRMIREMRKRTRRNRPLADLGLDPRSWLGRAKDEGGADVAGVETRHVSGTLDVERLLRNLNAFVRRSSTALGGEAPPQLTAGDIAQLSTALEKPSFDVYVGKRDDLIRRVSGRLEFEVPEVSREALGGLEGGSLSFSVELSDVNGDQVVEAPMRARPLSDLTDSLGTEALVGLTGVGVAEPVPAPDPDAPSGDEREPSPEAEAFERYTECLDKARPEETEELQQCSEILQQVP